MRRGVGCCGVVEPDLSAALDGLRERSTRPMPFAAPMESRPVIGSVDRVDPPWVLAEFDGGERLDLAVEHDREVLERVVRVSDKMRLVW